MRLLVRAGMVAAGVLAFCGAWSAVASADVVEPSSAYQPASTQLLTEKQKAPAAGEMHKPEPEPAALGEASQAPKEPVLDEAPATPAPEPQVRAVPAHITPRESHPESSVVERVTTPLRAGFQHIGSYLGRVVSTCQVAAGSGAGGPVLVLAVLSVVAAFERRRVFGTRPATDEDAPELLYATDVIKPG